MYKRHSDSYSDSDTSDDDNDRHFFDIYHFINRPLQEYCDYLVQNNSYRLTDYYTGSNTSDDEGDYGDDEGDDEGDYGDDEGDDEGDYGDDRHFFNICHFIDRPLQEYCDYLATIK